MTRFLSDALQATEPFFRQGVSRLEKANGMPNHDIRASIDVMNGSRSKLKQLGLDPTDTTPEELYYCLQEKVKVDDAKLTKTLRTLAAMYVAADGDVVAGMVHAIENSSDAKNCFAMKASSFKSIIRQLPPKKTMKALGFRSLDSFIKHESSAVILASARMCESNHWHQKLLDSYKKLSARDFEDRNLTVLELKGERFRLLAEQTVREHKHNIISLKELGALVFLPLPTGIPSGTVTASLSLGLHELNEIRASGTYLKLCQVRSDFGALLKDSQGSQPVLNSHQLDVPLPWHLVQKYFSLVKEFGGNLIGPHIDQTDLTWHSVEKALTSIEPAFKFWQDSSHLGVLSHHMPVSMNVLDVALNCCNLSPYELRITQYFQNSLWHDFLLRYLKPDLVEQTVFRQLQPELVGELA